MFREIFGSIVCFCQLTFVNVNHCKQYFSYKSRHSFIAKKKDMLKDAAGNMQAMNTQPVIFLMRNVFFFHR